MVRLVENSWLEKRFDDQGTRIIDPRPRVKYLQGHVPKAVNLPVSDVFDKGTLALQPEAKLREIFGSHGVDLDSSVVLYDSYDGQSAALLAWLFEYLGHNEVAVLSEYVEGWAEHGGKLLYRPVTIEPKVFGGRPGKASRAIISDVIYRGSAKLLDLRGQDEFYGKISNESRSGHIPGSINLPWTDLIGNDRHFLRLPSELKQVFSDAALKSADQIITYCSNGPRAALGYIALQLAGLENVRVYDGSFHQWAQKKDLPVDAGRDKVLHSKSQPSIASPCVVDNISNLSRAE